MDFEMIENLNLEQIDELFDQELLACFCCSGTTGWKDLDPGRDCTGSYFLSACKSHFRRYSCYTRWGACRNAGQGSGDGINCK